MCSFLPLQGTSLKLVMFAVPIAMCPPPPPILLPFLPCLVCRTFPPTLTYGTRLIYNLRNSPLSQVVQGALGPGKAYQRTGVFYEQQPTV